MTVGEHIKALRLANEWSKSELARRLSVAKGREVPRQSVINWEKGKEHPQAENIEALADVFNRPQREFEQFGARDTGLPTSAAKRLIPLLEWSDLKHIVAGRKMHKQALRKQQHLEVDDSVPTHAFALVIQDDSMAPRFRPGEEIVIDPKVMPVHDAEDPDFVLVRLKSGQIVFRQYVLRAPGAYDLVGLHKDCRTCSITPGEPAELLGTMVEHRRKRRRR